MSLQEIMTDPDRPRRILVVSSSERLASAAVLILRSAGHDVTTVPSLPDARRWLRLHRADVAVIDMSVSDGATGPGELVPVASLEEDARRGGARVLLLSRARGPENLRVLFEHGRLTNFLAVGEDERIEPVELTATISKIVSGNIFGIEKYLAPGAERHEIVVQASTQKPSVLSAVEELARRAGCHSQVVQSVVTVADELLTNAVYNAPIDAEGKPRYAHLPRSEPVILEPHEHVTITYAWDGRRLAISARDSFGSLSPDRILDYLSKCFRKGDDQVDTKAGGAGLGLFWVFSSVHHFVVNIARGQCTEAVGLLEVTGRYRDHVKRAKSFNVFVADGEVPGR